MLKGKKVLLMAALMLAVAFVFSACGDITKDNILQVGVDDTYPPMEYRDEQNNLVGFDVDLAKAIGEKLGMEVKFISNAWDGIFQALNTKKFDCIISSVSLTEDRLENFTFTKPYLANGQVIVVKPDNTSITKPEDLKDKKVGVQTMTTAHEAAKKYLEQISFELKDYDQIIQTFSDLKAGRLDAIVVDGVVAMDYVAKNQADYKVTTASLTNEPIAVCLKKGNTELRDKIQKALDELAGEGVLKQISEKWFGEDYTSNIDEKLR